MTDRDDAAAAEAIAELRALADDRIEEKAALPGAVLDVDHRDVTTLFSTDAIDCVLAILRCPRRSGGRSRTAPSASRIYTCTR